jgi:ComEC/Rec2-related protein
MLRYPALTAFAAMACGTAAGSLMTARPLAGLAFFLLAALLAAVFCLRKGKISPALPALFMFFCAGTALFQFRIIGLEKNLRKISRSRWLYANMQGTVLSAVRSGEETRIILLADRINRKKIAAKLSLRLKEALSPEALEGRAVSLHGRVMLYDPRSPRNYSMLASGLSGTASPGNNQKLTILPFVKGKSVFQNIKNSVKNSLRNALSLGIPSEAIRSIYIALILGERFNLPEDVNTRFKKTGTFHIFALSGMNYAIVVFAFLFILRLLRVKGVLQFFLLSGFALFYLLLTGFVISSLRAFVMIVLLLVSKRIYRDYSTLNALGACGLIFLAADPLTIFTPGFQLSFAAVLGLSTMYPLLDRHINFARQQSPLDRLTPSRWPVLALQKVVSSFWLCFSAWFFTAPILLFHFKEFSLFASLSNLIILPAVSLVTQLGFYSCFIGWLFPFAALAINLASSLLLRFVLFVVDLFYSSFYFVVQGDTTAAMLWFGAVIACVAFFLYLEEKRFETDTN